MFGADANWGRVLCAIGYTPGDFDIDKVACWLPVPAGEVSSARTPPTTPTARTRPPRVLTEDEIHVKVDMGTGDATAKAWGCDLTYDYVKINGDYRT